MTNGNINNSDLKVLGNKMDALTAQVGKLEVKQDSYHKESQTRLVVAEKQMALMQQSYNILCKDVETLEDKQDKNDLLTKIIGGLQGLLTAALIYLGVRQ
jgi:hypothetical protein